MPTAATHRSAAVSAVLLERTGWKPALRLMQRWAAPLAAEHARHKAF